MPVIFKRRASRWGKGARYETLSADYVHRLLYKGLPSAQPQVITHRL